MPLRPLNEKGQPKADKDLSADEIASRKIELEDDRRVMVSRATREIAEEAVLQRVQKR